MLAALIVGGLAYAAIGALAYVDEKQAAKARFGYWPVLDGDRALAALGGALWPIFWPMACSIAGHRPTEWRRSYPACAVIYWGLLIGSTQAMTAALGPRWPWALPVCFLGGLFSKSAIRRLHNKKGDPNGSRQAQANHHLGAGAGPGSGPELSPYGPFASSGASAGLGHPSGGNCPCPACVTYRNVLAGVTTWGMSTSWTTDNLPTERIQESVRAWKRARLRVDGGTLRFEGTGVPHTYSVEDTAVHSPSYSTGADPHPSPDPNFACRTCGFYAMSDRNALPILRWEYVNSTLDLEVELSGTIIEYEKGYRAQRQRVLAVWVDRHCGVCRSVSDAPPAATAEGLRVVEGNYVVPSCRSCTPLGLVSLSEASGLLGTEIRWCEP